jgi:acyl-CoA thioester hydrolase
MNPTPFSIQQSVYSEDTDMFGIVYHANYLKFFERARTEWLLSHNLTLTSFIEQNCLFVIKSAALEYRRPLRLHDHFVVDCQPQHQSKASILFNQSIHSPDSNTLYCHAKIILVAMDNQGKIIKMPQTIKELIE